MDKPDDKESFVDAYLYGIARTMHKQMYGLENTSEQFDKMIGSADAIKDRLLGLLEKGDGEDGSEEMIKIYSMGNLENILSYINKFELADSELVARNHVMVNSIINDTKHESLFAAVGAAHLPGDNGIIALLQKAGYTLTPVQATFTGVADKFHIDYNQMQWFTHTDDELGYSLDFPSEPIKTNIYSGITTWLFPDIANENFYGIYALPKGTKANPANRDKIINSIVSNFEKNKKDRIISRKSTIVNGLPCTDIIVKDSNGYQRSALFLNNNVLYYLYMGKRYKSVTSVYADRFFHSFKSFKVSEKPAKEWITFKNDTGAFSIKLPLQPYTVKKTVPVPAKTGEEIKINMFVASDTVALLNYFIRYNDYPLGNYLGDKEKFFNELGSQFSGAAKIVGKFKTIWLDGYEGREVRLIFNGGYRSVLRVYVRGNRLYMLIKQDLHEDEDVDNNDLFFNSFSFTNYREPTYINFEPKDGNFKIKLVSAPKIVTDSLQNSKSYLQNWSDYITSSPVSGGVYTLEHLYISKYFRTKSVDSLYKSLYNLLTNYTDTLIKVDTVAICGSKGRELNFEDRTTHDPKRYRLLVDGGDVFVFQSHLAKKELFNEESNTFYTSLERTGPASKVDLFSSKAGKIVTDLQSSDTTVQKQALGALNYYDFATDELPFVYDALKKSYPDDTTMGTRYKLINLLETVHDTSSVKQLLSIYQNLQDKDFLKSRILNAIPLIDKNIGYDIYLKLLLNGRPLKLKNDYPVFAPLYDSLDYAANHFKEIITLIQTPAYETDVLQLANKMVYADSPKYIKLLKDNFFVLTKNCYKQLDEFLDSKDSSKTEYSTDLYKYLHIMQYIKNEPLINKFTDYYITHNPSGSNISDAVIARINNHLKVNTALITRLIDSINIRYDILEALYKQKQFDKIPPQYKTQSEFGRLCLYQYISNDDYGAPEKLKLLGSITEKGMIYYAYQFRLSEKDEKATYIGICGPYKPGSTKLNFEKYNAYTEYEVKEANWIKQSKKLIAGLIKNYQTK